MTSYRYIRHSLVDPDDTEEGFSKDEFFESVISAVPSLPPHLRVLLRSRSPSRSIPPAPQRRRPRMWMQSTTGSEAFCNNSKRVRPINAYESDDEDDSSSDEEEDQCILPQGPRPAKKIRARYSTLNIRGTPDWLAPRPNTLVTFSKPLVTAVRTRPRTAPEEKSTLFYCKSDEMKFREEYRRERRLRLAGRWESDENDSSSSDDEKLCFPIRGQPTSTGITEKNIKPSIIFDKTVRGESTHKVSESSSSNEDEHMSDESTASSQSDDDEVSRVRRRKMHYQ